jgi:ribosomal protein S18 acetylase RimI-like enzyme
MRIRRLAPPDRESLSDLLETNGTFAREEIEVALELIDGAAAGSRDYHVLVCELPDCCAGLAGYICFGPTPMTDGTWDLYWIASRGSARGRGVGTALVRAMERELAGSGARIVRIETSQLDEYQAARSFYARLGYREVGRIRDFYRRGDDLVTLARRLDAVADVGLGDASRATESTS